MKEVLIKEYNNLFKTNKTTIPLKNTISYNFVKGAKLDISGNLNRKYHVEFIDQKNNKILYESKITNNMWSKSSIEYFVDYNIKVTDLKDNQVVFDYKFNAEGKRVYIHFASKALGDTLAWFPYAEEFRKKHKCEVIVSTFHNEMFEQNYPEITFIKPGENQDNLYAMYEVGWHYNEDKTVNTKHNPSDFKKNNLQFH